MNKSMYARILPPVPARCPSPMGTKGPHQLPPAEQVAEKLFRRKTFKPDGLRTSVLFAYFAQHFTHQFFKTDLQKGPEYTWGNHNVSIAFQLVKRATSEDLNEHDSTVQFFAKHL